MRYFFIEPSLIKESKAVITGSNAYHIRTVLRMKPGDIIGLFDGTGSEYTAKIDRVSAERTEVILLSSKKTPSESPIHLTVAQALVKGRKMDSLVRQLTELGISRWIPFVAARSVAKPEKERQPVRMTRWKAIAIEAAKQCKRSRLITIEPIMSFEEIIGTANQYDLNLVFYEEAKLSLQNINLGGKKRIQNILIVIGPEGGFSGEEIERAKTGGFELVGLGPRILKTETATLSACTIVQFLFGDLG